MPINQQDDSRIRTIEPGLVPNDSIEPEQLRSLFSSLRTQYTIFYNNYHRSGNLTEGDGEGDDDFFVNFVKGDMVYYYMHKVFDGKAPTYCTRDLDSDVSMEVGYGGSGRSGSSVSENSSKKRSYIDLTDSLAPTAEETEANVSMTLYFESQTQHERLRSLEATMNSIHFKNLPQEVQDATFTEYARAVAESIKPISQKKKPN